MPSKDRDRKDDSNYDILVLENKIDRLTEISEATKEDISNIKETVFNPQEGLYARLRSLESWKAMSTRIIWILIVSIVGLMGRIAYNQITEPNQSIIMPADLIKLLKEKQVSFLNLDKSSKLDYNKDYHSNLVFDEGVLDEEKRNKINSQDFKR